VLFDSGATHLFVSNECVRRLGFVMQELGCELIVATPASGEVSTTSMCVGCSMDVAGRKFKVNLICLLMEGLDMILSMDWLASNHIVIDCGQRRVVFPDAEGLELISSNQALILNVTSRQDITGLIKIKWIKQNCIAIINTSFPIKRESYMDNII